MNLDQEELKQQNNDYKINIQMVIFIIIIMVATLTLLYLIRIYSYKKATVIQEMETQAVLLETIISSSANHNIDSIISSLNKRKTNYTTNFVILDKKLNVIAKSKPEINEIIHENDQIFCSVLQKLRKINSDPQISNKDFSYLDMTSGVNYLIKPLDSPSFILVINIDNHFIKNDVITSIITKFLEVGFIAGICLAIIISLYKREVALRAKAEKATILANNAMETKTNFLSYTAHEIRSPLSFIITSSEVMSKELFGQLPKEYARYIDGINLNAKTILDFINDILDEEQLIAGQFKIVNSLNKIEDIIMQVLSLHNDKKDISIVTNFAPELPSLICDKRRIFQVIDNLVNNSIKYSKKHTTITIAAYLQNKKLVVTIADQGIGMKQEDIPIALSKYGMLHNHHYQKGVSYGLGLSVVKMLLDAHEASLDLQSVEGIGTTVKITFPKFKIVYIKEKS